MQRRSGGQHVRAPPQAACRGLHGHAEYDDRPMGSGAYSGHAAPTPVSYTHLRAHETSAHL
eukprot:2609132-Alexandrium_andersonii.AAC.2